MRRLVAVAVALVALAVAAVVLANTSSGGGDPYQVRAIFDDAAFAVPGEEVRIAGAPVGTIAALGVCVNRAKPCPPGTASKAAATLTINNSGFTPFRANAFCAIRPQSLIGEKYVDCNPGTAAYPPLPKIPNGQPGAGSYLLPVSHTHSPVDTDIVQDIYREPVRQQFSLIINELGTGLAGSKRASGAPSSTESPARRTIRARSPESGAYTT